MKRLALALAAVLIITFIAPLSSSYAQEQATESASVATATAQVNYTLAYPGILPDNPLYFLKATRDRLVSFLIGDNEKRAEFNLLTSDKRINAAFMLASKGKSQLSVDTLSKSNNYLEQAIASLSLAQKEGKEVNGSLHNIENAIAKHLDLVAGIKAKAGKKYAKAVDQEAKRLEKFDKSVSKLIKK